jgi:hypothetical protein
VRQLIWLVLIFVIISGCIPQATPEETPSIVPVTKPNPVVSSPSAGIMRVLAWVNNPTPTRGEQVIVYGSLLNYTVRLGGIMMQATWQDEAHQPGVPNCFVLVTYGRGVCVIETSQYPAGAYVPVHIRFDYNGEAYTGSTGFTPK